MTGATSVSTGTYRDINSSHLLHKAHSAADSPGGGRRSWGHRTHCTLSSNTLLPPTEKGQRQDGGDSEGRKGKGVRGDFDIYSNTKEHIQIASRHCAPIFTVNRQRNNSTAGPSV